MKKLVCLALLLGSIPLAIAQQDKSASPVAKSAIQSMVDTELAFARMSLEQGTRPAFMAFIADDGILFRPGAVKGKQWMTEHPVPPSDKRPLLSWYPAVADIAQAGDMGYTTGPWEYKADIHDSAPVAFGNFLTVWKKQKDETWKFAIDLGISNPKPEQAIAPWQPPKNHKLPIASLEASVEAAKGSLLARDGEFSSASVGRGAQEAFDSFAASNVRVFRADRAPFLGKPAALTALPESSSVWIWEPAFADVSRSGDLGYTYGTYRIMKKDALPTMLERGNYYRIWKKQAGKWLVVADLLDPVAAEK